MKCVGWTIGNPWFGFHGPSEHTEVGCGMAVKGTGLEGWFLEEPGSPVFSTNFLTIYKQMDPVFTSFLHS